MLYTSLFVLALCIFQWDYSRVVDIPQRKRINYILDCYFATAKKSTAAKNMPCKSIFVW